ncbi:Protein-L-isoaspartate O-methyltransferase [hydrothermal vent metagenome]|uniref:protein-L-isoaspartate(D-aspartate) O-methyltransferase n=1 Tax=hydrothermal vent metagenome TaxID=652676 RepID=A0A3B0TCR4_9ZZZZ
MRLKLSEKKKNLLAELRDEGIRDKAVLEALAEVPREDFIPKALRSQAYENSALPIDSGQTISQPYIVAFMTEALQVTKSHKVLEVGTGSGYQSVILAGLCRRLFTIERHLPLLNNAENIFKKLNIFNITTLFGNGMKGWPEQAPFDRIMVTAASEKIPERLLQQLKDGGVMVIPVGAHDKTQHIIRITRKGDDYQQENLLPVKFVPLLPGIVHES